MSLCAGLTGLCRQWPWAQSGLKLVESRRERREGGRSWLCKGEEADSEY